MPGKYSVVTLNGAGEKDACLWITYTTAACNSAAVANSDKFNISLVDNSNCRLCVYESYVKKIFTEQEYAAIKKALTPQEFELFEKYYSVDTYGADKSAHLSEWKLNGQTEQETKELFLQLDGLLKSHGLEAGRYLLCSIK